MFLASLMGLVVMASAVEAQTAGGADRYLGATQQSIVRTNGMISSLSPSAVRFGSGGLARTGAIQSVNRTNAMIQSMIANRNATMRGMQQQVIYRTPDNLYGVYWSMHNTRQAQIYSNVGGGGPRMAMMQALEVQKRRARERARSEELAHRFRQRSNPLPPHSPPVHFDTIQSGFSSAHLLNSSPQVTITAPSPIPRDLPRRGASAD
jgi:hypothetical protein